jgi:hypothetical protein
MGQLVMSFIGICMHVTKDAGLPDDVSHRVVVVDISSETKTHRWGDLPAHTCYLQFLPPKPITGCQPSTARMLLDGWNLRICNAVGPHVTFDFNVPNPPREAELKCVPSLKTYDPKMTIRPDLLEPGVPTRAACYVDINHGKISARRFALGGIYTTWCVDTDGEPELLLTPRGSDPQMSERLRLTIPSTRPGAHFAHDVPGSLALHNSTTDATDKTNDFVLHYVSASSGIPDSRDSFPHGFPNDGPQTSDMDMSTSCSNSHYP